MRQIGAICFYFIKRAGRDFLFAMSAYLFSG